MALPAVSEVEYAANTFIIDKIKEFCSYVKNYDDNLQKLDDEHGKLVSREKDIRRKVEIGEQKLETITEEAAEWLNEVKKLMDDDIHKAEDQCCFGTLRFNLWHRYKMSQAAETKAKEIQKVFNYTLPEPVTLPVKTADLKSIPTQFLKGLESRKKLLEEILHKLNDDQVDAVGLYGMGGSGKTMLAKEVDKSSRAKEMFDEIVMVEISEAPNIERIQDEIAEAIDLPLHDVHTTDQRAKKLYNRLTQVKPKEKKDDEAKKPNEKKDDKGRKILIIIDNIWKKLDLDKVGIPHEKTKDFCCKLLLTTRMKSVCEVVGLQHDNILEVSTLDKNEAKDLFRARVGKRVDNGDYKNVEERLLNKCGGLPLSIVATANALRGKDLSVWQRFADELEKPTLSDVSNGHHETYSILETSYKLLKSKQKMLFLFACLFPLGSPISIEELMRYGIGMGLFQHVNSLIEAMKVAKEWVNELTSSSLLLDDDSEGHVKIHDVVRASAISFAAKDGHMFLVEAIPQWMWKETCIKHTAISLMPDSDYSLLNGIESEKLEKLILNGSQPSEFPDPFFQGMMNLKVLVLSDMNFEQSLPESIVKLKNLRTLHLERCKLGDVGVIGELVNLLVLSLRGSFVTKLPYEFGNLRNLQLLDLGGLGNLPKPFESIRIPANVLAELSRLEGLYTYDSFIEWEDIEEGSNDDGDEGRTSEGKGASIAELNSLRRLNVLEMHLPRAQQLPTHGDQFVSNLDKFIISVGCEDKTRKIMKSLTFSRVLGVHDADVRLLLNNSCLKALLKKSDSLDLEKIRGMGHLAYHLDEEGFKELKRLRIDSCNTMDYIINGHGDLIAFPNLEYLKLESLERLKMIYNGEPPPGMFANLRHLLLNDLPELQSFVLPVELVQRNLAYISVTECPELNFIFGEHGSTQSNGEGEIFEIFLKELNLIGLPKLESMLGKPKSSITSNVVQALFNPKIIFPSLEKFSLMSIPIIKLWNWPPVEEMRAPTIASSQGQVCRGKLNLSNFQNLKDIGIRGCHNLESLCPPSIAAALVQLERLSIEDCSKMEEVISKEMDQEPQSPGRLIEFRKLKQLSLENLKSLKSFYGGSYEIHFLELKELDLLELPSMSKFAMPEISEAFFHEKIIFPSLEQFWLISIPMTKLWDLSPVEEMSAAPTALPRGQVCREKRNLCNFQNLKDIGICGCDNLESLCPPFIAAALVQLEGLSIEHCSKMEEVISKEMDQEPQIPGHVIEFRKLKKLSLENLKSLKSFYGGSYEIHFLELKELQLYDLPSMTKFAMPAISKAFFHEKIAFPRLEKLTLNEIATASEVEELIENQAAAFDNENENDAAMSMFCGQFTELTLFELPRLKLIPLHLFKRVRCLSLWGLSWKYVIPADLIARGLGQLQLLEEIEIRWCENMEAIIEDELGDQRSDVKDDGVIVFPRLKRIRLEELDKARHFCSKTRVALRFPSLEQVVIADCFEFQTFSTGPLVAPKLQHVGLWRCPRMQSFLSGDQSYVLQLPSLHRVELSECLRMQSFSSGPLSAPKLSGVRLDGRD